MQAIVQSRYGSPDVLTLREVARPEPKDDAVLVRVHGSAVSAGDWVFLTGRPRLVRLFSGVRRPRHLNPGHDLAGVVEAVGGAVTRFKPGDAVYGETAGGAYAEYVCAAEAKLGHKPANLDFAEAAAAPVSGVTAMQGLAMGASLAGKAVLINGASGGVGSFAVQIAKAMGAEVAAVCHASAVELVRSLGADHVIDYTRDTFTTRHGRYDLMLDVVGNGSLAACRGVLKPGGVYVLVGEQPAGNWLGPIPRVLRMTVAGPLMKRKMRMLASVSRTDDLDRLRSMIEAERVRPVVTARYPLAEVAEAMRRYGEGHARGKVVIEI